MTLVVDANVVIKWFIDENLRTQARHIFKYQLELTAPDLLLAEVANIAWKKVRQQEIDNDQARSIVAALSNYIPFLVPVSDLIDAATKLALELNHPVYDCLYLACAQRFGSGVTADRKFFNRIEKSTYAGLMKFVDDPDLQLPLHIPLDKLHQIIKLTNLIDATRRYLVSSLTREKEFETFSLKELQPLYDSPVFRSLATEIEGLSGVEQQDALALGWLGQGHSGNDWRSIRDRAEKILNSRGRPYLRYVASLAVYFEQGLARLRDLQTSADPP